MIIELGKVSVETKGQAPGPVQEPLVGSKTQRLAIQFT